MSSVDQPRSLNAGSMLKVGGASNKVTKVLRPRGRGSGELLLAYGKASLPPAANPAIHGEDAGVTHLPQVVGSYRRTEPATAVEDYRSIHIRNASFDVALNHSFSQVNRAGKMVLGKFTVFANIHQQELFAVVEFLFNVVNANFPDAGLGIIHNLQKARRMRHCHFVSCSYAGIWPANVHSSGSLSSRSPRKTGARNFRPPSAVSWVHSENLISATRTGLTQCALFASIGPEKGVLFVSISLSTSEICFKVA